jgi:hypothetical protein
VSAGGRTVGTFPEISGNGYHESPARVKAGPAKSRDRRDPTAAGIAGNASG